MPIVDKYGEVWPDIKVGLIGNMKDRRANEMLQKYDKALVAKWIREKQRWGIFTKDRKGKEYLVFIVQNKDGSYRNIDRRDLISIVRADFYRRTKEKTLLKEIEAYNEDLTDRKVKQLRTDMEAISKENWKHIFCHGSYLHPLG